MKKKLLSKILSAKLIFYFALTFFATTLLVNNAFARHDDIKAGWAANGIASSLHNLSSTGTMLANGAQTAPTDHHNDASITGKGTSEMCVYCHTPHFTDRSAGPLWNRNFSGKTIEAYGTTIAKNVDGNSNMFSTIACLSCHDGVTTFDNLINQPGVGIGDMVNAPAAKQWMFRMGEAYPTVERPLDHFSSARCPKCHDPVESGGAPESESIPLPYKRLIIGEQTDLGAGVRTDLTNDHPIGVLYRGAGDAGASASLRARTVLISSIVMAVAKGERGVASPSPAATDAAALADGRYFGALVTGNLWAVKGFISDSSTIQDLLRSGEGQGSGNYVQCTSCHDAHFKNQTNPDKGNWVNIRDYGAVDIYDTDFFVTGHDAFEVNGLFLRRVGGNSDSGLCRTCHDKG